jgi:hypothetical protein
LHRQKYSLGHKHFARGKKRSYLAVFNKIEKTLLGLKFNLEAIRQSCKEIALQQVFYSGAETSSSG